MSRLSRTWLFFSGFLMLPSCRQTPCFATQKWSNLWTYPASKQQVMIDPGAMPRPIAGLPGGQRTRRSSAEGLVGLSLARAFPPVVILHLRMPRNTVCGFHQGVRSRRRKNAEN